MTSAKTIWLTLTLAEHNFREQASNGRHSWNSKCNKCKQAGCQKYYFTIFWQRVGWIQSLKQSPEFSDIFPPCRFQSKQYVDFFDLVTAVFYFFPTVHNTVKEIIWSWHLNKNLLPRYLTPLFSHHLSHWKQNNNNKTRFLKSPLYVLNLHWYFVGISNIEFTIFVIL